MSLDHGILNVPLSRRGDIDAQIDAFKAEHRRAAATSARDAKRIHIALRAEAIGLIEQVSDERMAELGRPHGLTARKCRKVWHGIAAQSPSSVIRVMRKELEVAA